MNVFNSDSRRLRVDRLCLKVDRMIKFNSSIIDETEKTTYFNKHCLDCNYCESDSQYKNYFEKRNCFDNLIKVVENAIDLNCYYTDYIAPLVIDR